MPNNRGHFSGLTSIACTMLPSCVALFSTKHEKLLNPTKLMDTTAKRTTEPRSSTKSPKTRETNLTKDEACDDEPAPERTARAAAIAEFRRLASC